MKMFYGFTVVNPEASAKIIMPVLTWREHLENLLREAAYIAVQAALLAGSVTAFAWGFGAFR